MAGSILTRRCRLPSFQRDFAGRPQVLRAEEYHGEVGICAFVLLLLSAHGVGDFSKRLAEPLSMFRDGEQAWLGYVLFAALLLVSAVYVRDVIRAGEEEEERTRTASLSSPSQSPRHAP